MPNPPWKIRMLYDSLCPLCSREVAWLKRRNRDGAVDFEDIAAPAFDPARYGLTMEQAIGVMHAVKPDGTILRGVDVFVEVYRCCGLGWLSRVIAFRPTRPLMNFGYRVFAKLRPSLSKLDRTACIERCSARR